MKQFLVGALTAGVVLFAVGTAFHFLVPLVAPSVSAEYAAREIFRPWPGWTRTFMVVYPFAVGFGFAAMYDYIRGSSDRLRGAAGGAAFGLLLAIVGAIPVFLLCFAAVRLPASVAATWILQAFFQYVVAGAVLGAIRSRF